jgi:hypothetical protein
MNGATMNEAIYCLCYPNCKHPIGDAWGKNPLTWEQVEQARANNPHINIGAILGPISGLIDVECDSEEASEQFNILFGNPITPCWQSTRGKHYLFQFDPRLADLLNVIHYNDIEFRLGTNGQTQSLIPPSIVDGVKREWIFSPDQCPPAPIPEHVIQALLTTPKAKISDSIHNGAQDTKNKTIKKLLRYCERVGIEISSIREDHEGRIYLDLVQCPFSHPEHQNGGKPAIIVNDDGSWGFHCFHPDCANKTRKDLEEKYGPLDPIILLGPDYDRVVEQYIQALGNDDNTFQRAGLLTRIVHDAPLPLHCLNDNGAAKCSPILAPLLKVKMTAVAECKKWNEKKNDYVRCTPSDDIVNAILASGPYAKIPVLVNVVSAPILRVDGSIASKPGYDVDTGVYLDIDGEYPDLMPVDDAIALLDDILFDFPFAPTDANNPKLSAYKSAAIANLISLLARSAYRGSTPIFIYDANMPGCGKGKLTDVITTITENRMASRYDLPAAKDELSKVITSVAMSSVPYILFDNVKDRFGGKTLENAITAGRWTGRVLGFSRSVDLPLNVIWMATCNNAHLTSDMVRRTCHIRIETKLEHPDQRRDFRYPDLIGHVKEHRRELAIAALSIPAHYIKANRLDMNLPSWGGFEGWSDLVRQSLVWAKLPDPDTRELLMDSADDEKLLLRQLIDGWAELGEPMTVGDAIENASAHAPTLQNIINGLQYSDRHRALGCLLRDNRGRVCDAKKLERTGRKKPQWQVVEVGQ